MNELAIRSSPLPNPKLYQPSDGESSKTLYARMGIDAGSGVIRVADPSQIDFETTPVFDMVVQVSDDDGGSTSTTVTVNLLNQASISGNVFLDADRDLLFEANEMGLDAVVVELLDLAGSVLESVSTTDGGFYFFEDFDPGDYLIREIQPSGVEDGVDLVGSLGGTNPVKNTIGVSLGRIDATDYLFSEYGQALRHGDSASIGFWQNKHGQALIASGGTALATWLTETFGHVFGDQLAGATGQEIAEFYRNELFKQKGKKAAGPAKVDAHFMAIAFSTYFSSRNLAGDVAVSFGFNVTDLGLGAKLVSVGSSGDAFAVENDTELTVLQLLLATDQLTNTCYSRTDFALIYDYDGDGDIDSEEERLRTLANDLYSLISEEGGI